MKTQKLQFIILAFGSVFLTSCSELLYTSLDVLRPAKVAFDLNANNLLILNNTVIQPSNFGHRSESLGKKTKIVSVNTDSIALFCLAALTEEIESKNFFSTVQLIPNSQNTSNNFTFIQPLDEDSIKRLCNIYNANAILSLDKIVVNDDISEYYIEERNTFLAVLEVRFETFWSIHYPDKIEATPVHLKDTIYWESESGYNIRSTDLPKRIDGIIDGALYTGKKSVERFIPYWEKADRYFYNSPNKFIKTGIDSVYVKNWESAIQSWNKAYKSKRSRSQAYAANNLAVAYEITGNIDKALEYATIAYYSFSKLNNTNTNTLKRLNEYINELYQRKSELQILKKQLGN